MKPPPWYTRLLKHWLFTLFTVIVAVVGFIWGATSYISTAARQAVMDETFLAQLSSRVRPMAIFNSAGAIEVDLGASEYIEPNIEVKIIPEKYAFEITLHCKRHLAYAPMVSGVNVDVLPQSARRIAGNDWVIHVAPRSTYSTLATEEGIDPNAEWRFKVEVLH